MPPNNVILVLLTKTHKEEQAMNEIMFGCDERVFARLEKLAEAKGVTVPDIIAEAVKARLNETKED